MPDLVPQSPLMQPVHYHGQDYFTSQYFHAQYLANSPHGGKYRQHRHFLQALRLIDAYAMYCANLDIVELVWNDVKSGTYNLSSLFKTTSYNPITLLNATAQVALSHHLDDLASQALSVAVNRQAARKAPTLPSTAAQLAFLRDAHAFLKELGALTTRDTLMIADQTRNVLLSGQRLLPAGPDTPQPARMYSIAERITALGYALTRDQAAALVPKAGKKVAVEWRERYGAEPGKEARYVDGAVRDVNAYPSMEMDWIDAVLQGYLAGFPGLRRSQAV